MSLVSVPLKNEIAQQKDIFRLAATLYSETSDLYSSVETQLQMVKCMFVSNGNRYMLCNEIASELLDIYKYHISENEVLSIIDSSKRIFQSLKIDGCDAYKLTDDAYAQTVESQKYNIDYYIDKYIQKMDHDERDKCKGAIHQYLYELTTTNINSYIVLFSGKDNRDFSDRDLSVNVDFLSEREKSMVRDFLEWENDEKNVAISNVVYCCLEYCLLVNGDSPNKLLKQLIRKREVYLDTNVIFRALGINGTSRQKVVMAFLSKCKQAKVKIIISHSTKKEFFDTIDYYVSQITNFPRGEIFNGAYEQLSDYNIFVFYEKWHQSHSALSLKYFIIYIRSLYANLVSQYGITDDEKIPKSIYDSLEFKEKRNLYSSLIKNKKQELKPFYTAEDDSYSLKDSHDATIIRYVELLREKCDDKDIFIISSDKALRFWDMTRRENLYPVVIYPSQLFLILIKLCGRSANDYDSFVSFINISATSKQITPEKANIIISGISSITEDIIAQKGLISAVYDDEFQNILQRSRTDDDLYKQTQRFSQKYLEDQLKEKIIQINAISEVSAENEELVQKLQTNAETQKTLLVQKQQDIEEKSKELDKKREQICHLTEKQIFPKYFFCYYFRPVTIALLTLGFICFIGLQFFFGDRQWNFAVNFFDWVKDTTFGQTVGDFVYAIDAAFAIVVGFLLRKYMRNPFNKIKKEQAKTAMVQSYINDRNLY